jgi:transcriptional regulator with XRE-family HTH domain
VIVAPRGTWTRPGGTNATNDLRRTNEDKRRAVERALQHPKAEGMRLEDIAEHCGVTANMVSEYKRRIFNRIKDTPDMRTVTRNGKTYEMDVANVGRKPAATSSRLDDEPGEVAEDNPDRFAGSRADERKRGKDAREH